MLGLQAPPTSERGVGLVGALACTTPCRGCTLGATLTPSRHASRVLDSPTLPVRGRGLVALHMFEA